MATTVACLTSNESALSALSYLDKDIHTKKTYFPQYTGWSEKKATEFLKTFISPLGPPYHACWTCSALGMFEVFGRTRTGPPTLGAAVLGSKNSA